MEVFHIKMFLLCHRYHWMCVGIQSEPADNQDWFCPRCVAKKTSMYLERKTPGKRGRPPKIK